MTADDAIELMIRLEGGYADVSGDPGGATKYGITQRTLDSLQGKALPAVLPKNVVQLTPDQAHVIYRAVDWAAIHGDELPGALGALMLNSAVNQGEPTAVILLQNALGVTADGAMGPHTLSAIAVWKSSYMPGQTLAEEFAARVAAHYAQLYPTEAKFELGWFRRLMRVYTLALTPPSTAQETPT